jgi:hypothetical protein
MVLAEHLGPLPRFQLLRQLLQAALFKQAVRGAQLLLHQVQPVQGSGQDAGRV